MPTTTQEERLEVNRKMLWKNLQKYVDGKTLAKGYAATLNDEMPPAFGGYHAWRRDFDYSNHPDYSLDPRIPPTTKKEIVPPRDERLEKLGNPKPPKMGNIQPSTVELPDVDNLLERMKKISE